MVVEDHADTREFYRLTLKAEGYRIVAIGDGVEALRQLEIDPPALIVLDLGLPLLSGRDVAREVTSHADTRHIPIVMVTGSDTADLTDVTCIIRKPVNPDALIATVRRCLVAGRRSEV